MKIIEIDLKSKDGDLFSLLKERGITSDSFIFKLVPQQVQPSLVSRTQWFPTQQAAHAWLRQQNGKF